MGLGQDPGPPMGRAGPRAPPYSPIVSLASRRCRWHSQDRILEESTRLKQ